jgi:hypothetical protein
VTVKGKLDDELPVTLGVIEFAGFADVVSCLNTANTIPPRRIQPNTNPTTIILFEDLFPFCSSICSNITTFRRICQLRMIKKAPPS